jgi:hypothetical protein
LILRSMLGVSNRGNDTKKKMGNSKQEGSKERESMESRAGRNSKDNRRRKIEKSEVVVVSIEGRKRSRAGSDREPAFS